MADRYPPTRNPSETWAANRPQALRRGTKKMDSEAIKTYLKRLGFPRTWSRSKEALALLKGSGFPVSPAAQEIIRRYGGINTHSAELRPSIGFYIDPFDVIAEDIQYTEHVHRVRDLCPIGYNNEGLSLMCIGPDNTIYFQGGSYFKGATVDEALMLVLSADASGESIPPDEEPL